MCFFYEYQTYEVRLNVNVKKETTKSSDKISYKKLIINNFSNVQSLRPNETIAITSMIVKIKKCLHIKILMRFLKKKLWDTLYRGQGRKIFTKRRSKISHGISWIWNVIWKIIAIILLKTKISCMKNDKNITAQNRTDMKCHWRP